MNLKIKGFTLSEGCKVTGTINGIGVEGKINIYEGNLFFCQNKLNGSKGDNLYGYNNSWSFKIKDNGECTEQVIISKVGIKESSIKKGSSIINVKSTGVNQIRRVSKIDFVTYYDVKYGMFPKLITNTVSLFNMNEHPDCCGSRLLYNFDRSKKNEYSLYKYLKPKDYEDIKYLLNNIKAAKLVHLSHKQTIAIEFVEKLGFKKQYEYYNNNSGNTILVYHQNPK